MVEITSPVNGDVFTVGKEVTFAGTAGDGIVRVGLLADGQWPLPGGELADGKWSASYRFNTPGNPRLIKATGFDDNNNPVGTSDEVSIILEPELKNLVPVGSSGWHSRFGGIEWRYDQHGVYIRSHQGGNEPLRTPGSPVTCQDIWYRFRPNIINAAQRYSIPPELLVMTIATETAIYRQVGYTGPSTFRWEAHVEVKDDPPPFLGDYSAGPMQTLASTARWVIRQQNLNYEPFQVAPAYRRRPDRPGSHPLYEAAINIDIGTAEIKQRWNTTGDDPVLVAAVYNAGGLYQNNQNLWKLRSHHDHIDRAVRWFGDACAVLADFREQ
jgi:peptidoglycan L-alanyl-D-glutamate endopeptidase CwlK